MITINYITSDCWWDTDKTILPSLAKRYRLNVFSYDCGANMKYKTKENYGFNYFLVYKQKHPLFSTMGAWEAGVFIVKMINKLKQKDSLIFVIPMWNPYLSILFSFFLPRNRTIFSFHNYIDHTSNSKMTLYDRFINSLKKRIYSHFYYFHFYSDSQIDKFRTDYPQKNLFLTSMPLKDFGHQSSSRFSQKPTFLFFGFIRYYKRLDLFIKAANEVDAFFVIAGECPEKEWQEYDALIKDRSNFSLNIGFVDDKSVSKYFENVDFLVLPYEDATQSGPSLIAINYGLPIIASNQKSFKKIIEDSRNGFLFESGDEESLRMVMKKACNLTYSELLEMRTNQLKVKKKYERESSPISTMDRIASIIFEAD